MKPKTRVSDGLETIYREYRQPLFTCALAVTGCPGQAEDAIHEAFCRLLVMERIPSDLKAYVFGAVRNAAIDQLRRNPSMESGDCESIFDPDDGPRQTAGKSEFAAHVHEALLTLSGDERETIVEHLYSALTFREIAEMRAAPLGTVTAWYRRGLEKLRQRLENEP